jgi:hypothetical protein
MKKIEVTDNETGKTTTYDFSRDNWAQRWACMIGGLVHMWAPRQLSSSGGSTVITSGRTWRVTA